MLPTGRLLALVLLATSSCAGDGPGRILALGSGNCGDVRIDGARCVTVTVPEDRTRPDGRTIALRVVVLPATGAAAGDPIVFLAGGPGQAASQLARGWVHSPFRETRDLVFADQRGTGGSADLQCAFYDSPPNGRFDDFIPASKVQACRAALERDADLAQYTTSASVADLEEIRRALRYRKLNLIGGSYGTRLAMEYVRAHEAHVRSVILEGPVPTSMSVPDAFGALAQRALDGVLEECLADTGCSRAFPRIEEEAQMVFDRLRKGPVTVQVEGRPVEMTRDHVAEALRYMLYTSEDASRVPFVLHAAALGDFSEVARFLRTWRRGGTFDAVYLSITCAEDVPFVPADAADRDEPTFLGGYRVRQQRAACAGWPRGSTPSWRNQAVKSRVPVLIVSGMLDPVTPPACGDEVARTLPNSLHVQVPAGGHSWRGLVGWECVERLKHEFIDRGSAAGLDASCARKIRRRGFHLGDTSAAAR
jgi:pimeloyl-ACP methyl ester carboxylesterase